MKDRTIPLAGSAASLVSLLVACTLPSGTNRTQREAPQPASPDTSIAPERTGFPSDSWPTATPAEVGMDVALLDQARDYALAGGGSGFIVRYGKRVYTWGELSARFELKSATKSIGSALLGLAVGDGLMKLADRAQSHLPSVGTPPDANAATGWLDDITVLQLATMTAGFEKSGGFGALLHEPGSIWRYTDGGTNWLADVLTQVYGQDLDAIFFDRVMTPLGIARDRLTWRSNAYRPDSLDGVTRREFGSGITSDVETLARIGYLFLRRGVWSGERILDEHFIDLVRRPMPSTRGLPVHEPDWAGASDQYGVLWMTNDDGHLPGVPRDAYWAHGLGEALIFVIPSLDLVVTRLGREWERPAESDWDVLTPFIGPIARAAR
jgi:CubicO group peptidase (beta-lactamase class C family)